MGAPEGLQEPSRRPQRDRKKPNRGHNMPQNSPQEAQSCLQEAPERDPTRSQPTSIPISPSPHHLSSSSSSHMPSPPPAPPPLSLCHPPPRLPPRPSHAHPPPASSSCIPIHLPPLPLLLLHPIRPHPREHRFYAPLKIHRLRSDTAENRSTTSNATSPLGAGALAKFLSSSKTHCPPSGRRLAVSKSIFWEYARARARARAGRIGLGAQDGQR